jgi:hypothetical protein
MDLPHFNYELGKFCDGISGHRPPEMALMDVRTLRPKIDAFEEQVKAAYSDNYESEGRHDFVHLRHALDKLERYFGGEAESMNDLDAMIYRDFLALRIDDMKDRYGAT